MGTLISIPGVSQLLGCTPLGPLGWAQALGSAGAATAAVAVATRVFAEKRSGGAGRRARSELRPSRHHLHSAEAPQNGVQLGQRDGQQASHSSA